MGYREGEKWASWRVPETEEGLRDPHLQARAKGIQGRGTEARGVSCGRLDLLILGVLQGFRGTF